MWIPRKHAGLIFSAYPLISVTYKRHELYALVFTVKGSPVCWYKEYNEGRERAEIERHDLRALQGILKVTVI